MFLNVIKFLDKELHENLQYFEVRSFLTEIYKQFDKTENCWIWKKDIEEFADPSYRFHEKPFKIDYTANQRKKRTDVKNNIDYQNIQNDVDFVQSLEYYKKGVFLGTSFQSQQTLRWTLNRSQKKNFFQHQKMKRQTYGIMWKKS